MATANINFYIGPMNPIPENYTDFLHWLKDHTETYWAQDPRTSMNEAKCPLWIFGAKWVGMTEGQGIIMNNHFFGTGLKMMI
ncbi:hypothetical protein A4H97_08590 [Niastella yeongjuensis]|uniref:Uncharacterized protein n=1 Tax=Niastella yeongjuensis TaxID=354355 RepID=A0A1V9EE76_9BACT|nr:hypothetical protein [Niastella yeongjuensis]OQP44428.1 hypothetical protein A4H97_08590 [Niastella yeongjuensis]SEO88012.1 hypothetical protein SAMN05660816_03828 [Niastella yeongjuensis]